MGARVTRCDDLVALISAAALLTPHLRFSRVPTETVDDTSPIEGARSSLPSAHGAECRGHFWFIAHREPYVDQQGHSHYYTLYSMGDRALFLTFGNRRTALEPEGLRQGLLGAIVLASTEVEVASAIGVLTRAHRGDFKLKAD